MITIPEYGMFTDQGNLAIAALINYARVAQLTWPETYQCLDKLSNNELYGEAMDTEVRECVYSALNFTTLFYF